MSAALQLPSSRKQSFVPVVAALVLLLARLLVIDRATGSVPALALIYLLVLAICSSDLRDTTRGSQMVMPLAVGAVAVLSARFMLTAPLPVAATATGMSLIVLAAIAEEALFRGLMFGRLLPYGRNIAIAASAVAFALIHLPFYGPRALPVDLGAGLLFAWQRNESGSWAVPAATHVLANILAVLP